MGSNMSQYFFRISHGRYSGASDQGTEFESRADAWAEMTKVCANLLGGISRSLRQNAEWRMELLDESRKPALTWEFSDGWPSKWAGPALNAKNNEIAIEEMEICVEGLALQT